MELVPIDSAVILRKFMEADPYRITIQKGVHKSMKALKTLRNT
jgi:hypothetical protein